VYSTCTFAEAENEAQVRWMVNELNAQTEQVESLSAYATGDGSYRLWPHMHQCAGSFAASLRADTKPLDSGSITDREARPDRVPCDLHQWYTIDALRTKVQSHVVLAWPNDVPAWVHKIAVAGPEVAYRTGQTWKPSHGGGLIRSTTCTPKSVLEVDETTAEQFLDGMAVPCQSTGWHVVALGKRPLGWIKASQGRGKNQLPAAARVRVVSV